MYDITTGTGDFVANGVISPQLLRPRDALVAWKPTPGELGFDPGDRRQGQCRRGSCAGGRTPDLDPRTRRARHEHRSRNQRAEGRYGLMPGIIKALAGVGYAVQHPHQGHPAAPGHPAPPASRRRRTARARRLARDLRRRAARGARAGHAGPAGPVGPGTCAAGLRPPVRGHAGARPALADRHPGAPRQGRELAQGGRRHRRHGARPAPQARREGVVLRVARPRAT